MIDLDDEPIVFYFFGVFAGVALAGFWYLVIPGMSAWFLIGGACLAFVGLSISVWWHVRS